MAHASGFIEVDMFSKDVNNDTHPDAVQFKKALEEVAQDYRCTLTHFEVSEGTVSFSFDSEVLMADILTVLQLPADKEKP